MPHGINRHVLTGANPFINNGIHALLNHGFLNLIMSYQGHRINPPSANVDLFYLDIFFRKLQLYVIGKEAFRYRWGNA